MRYRDTNMVSHFFPCGHFFENVFLREWNNLYNRRKIKMENEKGFIYDSKGLVSNSSDIDDSVKYTNDLLKDANKFVEEYGWIPGTLKGIEDVIKADRKEKECQDFIFDENTNTLKKLTKIGQIKNHIIYEVEKDS